MLAQVQYCRHGIPISSDYSCAHCDKENAKIKRAVPRYPNPLEDFTKQKATEQQQIADLLAERKKTHGSYAVTAFIAQHIKDEFRQAEKYKLLNENHRESLDLIATKIARILNGNPNEIDHWKDIAGYATLIVEQLEKK